MIDPLEELERRALRKQTRDATISGTASGAVLGGVGSILAGSRRARDIAKAATLGGLASGALTGGATYLGGKLLGPSGEDEANPNARRGGVGGALGGGLLGGAVGAALGKWGLPKIAKAGIFKKAVSDLPLDNLLTDKLKAYAANPGRGSAIKGGLIGGGSLGAAAAFLGADEGMQLDAIQAEIDAAQRRRVRALQEAGLL